MSVKIKIPTIEGITLKTKNKYVKDDIAIILDSSLIPQGNITITENGVYDVSNYEKVNVEVTGESNLKSFLDVTKTLNSTFLNQDTITDLSFIRYNDTENVSDFQSAFEGCSSVTTPFKLNMASAITLQNTFRGCTKVETIQLDNTNNVLTIQSAFAQCNYLINLSKLNTDKVNNFQTAFSGCAKLKLIDISKFTSASSNTGDYICTNCRSLKALVIRSFGASYVLGSSAFTGCYHILGTVNATYNPDGLKDGFIYVPSATIETLSKTTNWTTYATQFRALEDYTLDGTTTGELDLVKMGF